MDKELIAYKFSKSLASYNQEAFAQKKIAKRLFDLLQTNCASSFDSIFEFGTGTGLFTSMLVANISYQKLLLNDLSLSFKDFLFKQFSVSERSKMSFFEGDIEQIEIKKHQDLIVSSSTEQWIENKELFYHKIYKALKKDGYFVFSTFGTENLKQVRKASGRSLNYLSIEKNKELLSKYFDIISVEEEKINLEFKSGLDILTHIKKTGVNAISRENWNKKSVFNIIKEIEKTCKQGKYYTITYHPIYFVLKKKN